jgi:Leucine-rich repeat (LRR) protein
MPLKQLQVGYDPNWDMEQLRGIGNLRQLEYLIIAACPFDDEGLSRIEPLQDLKLLWLPQTEIRGDGLKYVDATDLQSLDLSSTRISNATLAQLQRFQDLTELNLLGTSISDDGLKHLLHLKKLKVLVLNATKITNEGLATLSEMKNLERLSLADTRIDDKNLSQLSRLISLKWLDLRYTHTSEGAARRLSTSLPYHPVLSDSFISAVSGE